MQHSFEQWAQLPGELVDAFVSALCDLSSDCGFGAIADTLIGDPTCSEDFKPSAKGTVAPRRFSGNVKVSGADSLSI